MKPNPAPMSLDELRGRLSYDAETGVFTYRKTVGRLMAGDVAGGIHRTGYRHILFNGKQALAHRLAWFHHYGEWPLDQVDHINGDRADNRIANLRAATHHENARNRRKSKNGFAPYKGVVWRKHDQKWAAQININKRPKTIGRYDTPEEAHAAYCEEAKRLWGEFASTG